MPFRAPEPDVAVYPKASVLIQNPVAVVDKNAEKDCVLPIAQSFVKYLHTADAKADYTDTGFLRSTNVAKAQAGDPANGFPAITLARLRGVRMSV